LYLSIFFCSFIIPSYLTPNLYSLLFLAPTDEAFAALPDGTVESLLEPENIDQLTAILQYHVITQELPSSSLTTGPVETSMGATVEVTVSDDGVTVNDANVITPDVMACNGIIHVIDKVLLPGGAPAEETDSPTPAPTVKVSLLVVSSLTCFCFHLSLILRFLTSCF